MEQLVSISSIPIVITLSRSYDMFANYTYGYLVSNHAESLKAFFFFQAEDGIRYVAVTGVQTCALPICILQPPYFDSQGDAASNYGSAGAGIAHEISHRSEERRVGKECRSRWSPYN